MVLGKLRLLFVIAICDASTANSQENDDLLQEVVTWGRSTDLVGEAHSASQGIVGYEDLNTRPILRVGELVEVVPGMIATQHSGGGKANQYFLRGINLDHGTDFSIAFEGMPVNFRTHAHGQGYLDMNFIIPELVKTIEYRKGTHAADVGDFSAAASTKFDTYNRLDEGFVKLTIGSEEYQRLVAAGSWDSASGTWLGGLEVQYSDGPWENPEDTKRYNGLLKYTTDIGDYSTEFIGTAYSNDWNATDQIPQRAVDDGTLDRFGFVDPTVGGESYRYNLIANFTSDTTYYQAFASSYGLNLFGNPTYFLNDAVNGDQIEQEDRRTIIGGRMDRSWRNQWRNHHLEVRAGLDTRYDMISKVNLFNTSLRERLTSVRDDAVDELSVGAYAEVEVFWSDKLRTTFGLRGDAYQWDVSSDIAENSGSGSETTLNPKLGLAYTLNDRWELYANFGTGFHSNDVRAAELTVDPVSGEPAESFDVIVNATGLETGFRANLHDKLNFSVAIFYLELDSELIFVGDAGTTEPNDATERTGIEAALFWQPNDSLTFDITAAKTDAKFSDAPGDANQIPDAHDTVGAAGVTLVRDNGFTSSVRVRYFGDAPLVEDGSIRKAATTLVNLGFAYPMGRFVVGLDVLNLFDAEDNDIDYYYESRLSYEPAGVEGSHFHPVESREFRLKLGYTF